MRYLQCTTSAGTDFKIISPKDDESRPTPQIIKRIHVSGGANVRDAKSLATPLGMCTEVSEEDYALLEKNHTFQEMVANGSIVVTSDHHLNVKDNKPKDNAAPRTPEDFVKRPGGKAPTTGSPEEE